MRRASSPRSSSGGLEPLPVNCAVPAGRSYLGLGTLFYQISPCHWVETRATDQHTIELGSRQQRGDVAGVYAPTVEDGNPTPHTVTTQFHADQLVDLGGVVRGGVLPGSDGPDRLVREHEPGPVGRVQHG